MDDIEFHIDHPSARDSSCLFNRCAADSASPLPVIRENVISRLRSRMAREPALGVVPLRRRASCGAGLERIGRGVVVEHGPSPSAAVREPLAVLLHEIYVQQAAEATFSFRLMEMACHPSYPLNSANASPPGTFK